VTLSIDAERQVKDFICEHCGAASQRVTGFIHRDGDALAVYFASCYHHGGHEVWIDVVFSPTWADEVDDRETFGCRVGPIDGPNDIGSSLVRAGIAFPDSKNFGHKLTRDEACHTRCLRTSGPSSTTYSRATNWFVITSTAGARY